MIQIYCFPKQNRLLYSYFYLGLEPNPIQYMPFFDRQMVEMNFLKRNFSLIDFVIAMIDMDYYCFLILNEFYLPCKDSYQRQSFEHGVMVYGYDAEKQTIFISGYNKSHYFGFDTISFSEFEEAFLHTKNENIICFRRNSFEYDFDVDLMKKLINDFCDSTNTSLNYRMLQNPMKNCYWGIDACKHIISSTDKVLNYKDFYTIYEYITLMIERIDVCSMTLDIDLHQESKYCMRISKELYLLLLHALKSNFREYNADKIHIIQTKLNGYMNELKDVLSAFLYMIEKVL